MEIKYEPTIGYKPVYISIDGTQYYTRAGAVIHDAASYAGTRYVEQENIDLPDDETHMTVSYITCKEDWDYLYYTQWEQSIFWGDYTGPGWYGSIKHDGGDYRDEYEIVKIDENYIQKYTDFLNELKDLTFRKN